MNDIAQHEGPLEARARWMYRGIWSALVRWFQVPADPPDLPAGSDELVHAFQPDDGYLRYLKLWFWIVAIIIDVCILACVIIIIIVEWWIGLLLLPVAVALMFLPDIIAYISLHLRFDTTWYVMTDHAVRIRRGIWVIRETTITYENVQNVKLVQGPVERVFGIGSVIIETAGGVAAQPGHTGASQGLIQGIANAAEVRDRIMMRARLSRSSGLGDDDAQLAHAQAGSRGELRWTPAHLQVLREIRDALGAARTS